MGEREKSQVIREEMIGRFEEDGDEKGEEESSYRRKK